MTTARFDVIGLGNAIVDVIARADDGFLAQHGIAKGGMTLIDAHRAKVLEDALADTTIVPGGSAANTIAGIASLGGEGAFIGRVHADWLGEGFAAVESDSSPGNPHGLPRTAHSVLTRHLVDEPGHPTHAARERVLAFFRERLLA